MCGKYSANGKINHWILNFCQGASEAFLRTGDIRPGEAAPAIIMGKTVPLAVPMIWGFKKNGGGLIINARKETLWKKPMFRQAAQTRRCLLPAACFYEWDGGKHRAAFCGQDEGILFLAGIYEESKEGRRFVIITSPADETVKPIHDRMPLRITEASINDWLSHAERARVLMDAPQPPLLREQAVEQMCLWEQEEHF